MLKMDQIFQLAGQAAPEDQKQEIADAETTYYQMLTAAEVMADAWDNLCKTGALLSVPALLAMQERAIQMKQVLAKLVHRAPVMFRL